MTTLPDVGNPAGSFSPGVPPSNTSSGGANLVEQIAQFIERFVFIKERSIYHLLALWVIQTHCYKRFYYTGYLYAHSTEPESGKIRLLELLHLLVANSSGVQNKPTEAILFRTADGHTQLLDEVDAWTNGDVLRSVLNAGFQKGGLVKRAERNAKGQFEPRDFPVYCPRAMAGIGLTVLHETTRSRTFLIGMVRRKLEERSERFRPQKVRPEAEKLKAEIVAWVSQHGQSIADLYNRTDELFPYLSGLRERTLDVAEPLAAILEIAYAETPSLESKREQLLEAISLTRKDGEDSVMHHAIVQELSRLAGVNDPLVGNASELASKLELSPYPTKYEVSATLRRYGFESRSIRVGKSVLYRYELSKARLAEILARHEPPHAKPHRFDDWFDTPAPEPDVSDRAWLAAS